MAKPKRITNIDCAGELTTAIKRVLSIRMNEMCALRETALVWSDPEGVHDMRVASRRLRSVLSDFAPCLGKNRLNAAGKHLKEISGALGEVRDQDVAIHALQTLSRKTPDYVKGFLKEVVGERKKVRSEARKDLGKVLQEASVRRFQKEFEVALESISSTTRRTKKAAGRKATYQQIGKSIIRERLRDFEKLSTGLYQPLEVEPLHELRIATKRLRYSLEVFEACWGKPIVVFARKLSVLQTSLGDLHDCDVWIESFGKTGAKARKNKGADENALTWLLSHLMNLRAKHFTTACRLWRQWEEQKSGAAIIEHLQTKTIQQKSS